MSPKETIVRELDERIPFRLASEAEGHALAILSALEREGWKVLNRKPTEAMKEAGYQIDGSYTLAEGCWELMWDAA